MIIKIITYVAYCDGNDCKEDYDTDAEDFYSAIDEIKREGWACKKINGEWLHLCPACAQRKNYQYAKN
jgi:hypothetical protein